MPQPLLSWLTTAKLWVKFPYEDLQLPKPRQASEGGKIELQLRVPIRNWSTTKPWKPGP